MSARTTSLSLSSDDESSRKPRRIVTPFMGSSSLKLQSSLKRSDPLTSARNDTSANASPLNTGRLSGLQSERSARASLPVSAREKPSLKCTPETSSKSTGRQPEDKLTVSVKTSRAPTPVAPDTNDFTIRSQSPVRLTQAIHHREASPPNFRYGVSGGSALDKSPPRPVHMLCRPTHPKTLAELEADALRKGSEVREEEAALWGMVIKAARKGALDAHQAVVIRTNAVNSPMYKRLQEVGHMKRTEVEERERQRELQEETDATFHPGLSKGTKRLAAKDTRDSQTYYDMQVEWKCRLEEKMERVRGQRDAKTDEEVTGRPIVSPVSEAIIKALREESRSNKDGSPSRMLHTSYMEGWAERLADRDRRLKEVQARHQPSFKPQITPYNIEGQVEGGETRDARLYKIASELQAKRQDAQKSAIPATNCQKKSKEEIDEFMVDMLKRTADAQRRKHFKIKRLQREAAKIENNGSTPATNDNSAELAARHRQRTEEREAAKRVVVVAEEAPPTSNVIKTATRRSERFLINQELSHRRRLDTVTKLEEEQEERFASEYTFAPRITAKSRALAANASTEQDRAERGPSFLDPTEAQKWRQFHVEGAMEELYTRKADEEIMVGKPKFVVGTSNSSSKHITVPGAHHDAIFNRERAKLLADRHYQDMLDGRPLRDYSLAELEEVGAAIQDGFLEGSIHLGEDGQAYYIDNDGEAVAISAEEETALMDEMRRLTPTTSPERGRKHQPRSASPWEEKFGTPTKRVQSPSPNATPVTTPKARTPKARTTPSRVDAVGGEHQQEPVDHEDGLYTPGRDRKEKKAKKDKKEKTPKDDLVSQKEREAKDLLDKWRGMAE